MKIESVNLVMQLQLRNKKALEYLVREHGERLNSIIRKHLFTLPHLQLECLTDTVLCIWNHMEDYDEENEFENWIGSVARYQCIVFLRKHQQEATIAWLIEKEIAEEKEVMLDCLEEQERQIFLRFYEEGEPGKDAAEYREASFHTMYELMNRIDTDIYEYERTPLESRELLSVLETIKQRQKEGQEEISLLDYLDVLVHRAQHKRKWRHERQGELQVMQQMR